MAEPDNHNSDFPVITDDQINAFLSEEADMPESIKGILASGNYNIEKEELLLGADPATSSDQRNTVTGDTINNTTSLELSQEEMVQGEDDESAQSGTAFSPETDFDDEQGDGLLQSVVSWEILDFIDEEGEVASKRRLMSAPPRLVISDSNGLEVGEIILSAGVAKKLRKAVTAIDMVWGGEDPFPPRKTVGDKFFGYLAWVQEHKIKGPITTLFILAMIYAFIMGLVTMQFS